MNQHAACSIETAPAEPERTRFYLGVVVFMFLAILGALYWTILRDLVWQWWEDPNYSHGNTDEEVKRLAAEVEALTASGLRHAH